MGVAWLFVLAPLLGTAVAGEPTRKTSEALDTRPTLTEWIDSSLSGVSAQHAATAGSAATTGTNPHKHLEKDYACYKMASTCGGEYPYTFWCEQLLQGVCLLLLSVGGLLRAARSGVLHSAACWHCQPSPSSCLLHTANCLHASCDPPCAQSALRMCHNFTAGWAGLVCRAVPPTTRTNRCLTTWQEPMTWWGAASCPAAMRCTTTPTTW